jgi:lipoprotein
MMKQKLMLILGVLGLCIAILTACSGKTSKNADGTPSTLKSRYLGYYRSDTDNATYFDETTNEFDFDVNKSTISDGTAIESHIKTYQVLSEDELASNFKGPAEKNKAESNSNDTIFYIQIKGSDQSIYQVKLSDGGKKIKIISLGDGWDQFVFTGVAK